MARLLLGVRGGFKNRQLLAPPHAPPHPHRHHVDLSARDSRLLSRLMAAAVLGRARDDWAPALARGLVAVTRGVGLFFSSLVPLLVRAGATINERYADRSDYLKAVLEAGGIRAYERLHRSTLANILTRGNRLPADVIPKIVDYWAHVGWYAIEKDDREYDPELDGPDHGE